MSSTVLINALLLALSGADVQPVETNQYVYTQESYTITQTNTFGEKTSWVYSKDSLAVIETAATNALLAQPETIQIVMEIVEEDESDINESPIQDDSNVPEEETKEACLPEEELK